MDTSGPDSERVPSTGAHPLWGRGGASTHPRQCARQPWRLCGIDELACCPPDAVTPPSRRQTGADPPQALFSVPGETTPQREAAPSSGGTTQSIRDWPALLHGQLPPPVAPGVFPKPCSGSAAAPAPPVSAHSGLAALLVAAA